MRYPNCKRSALAASLVATIALPTIALAKGADDMQHVLLISIDGFHQLDLANCSKGAYYPNLEALTQHGL